MEESVNYLIHKELCVEFPEIEENVLKALESELLKDYTVGEISLLRRILSRIQGQKEMEEKEEKKYLFLDNTSMFLDASKFTLDEMKEELVNLSVYSEEELEDLEASEIISEFTSTDDRASLWAVEINKSNLEELEGMVRLMKSQLKWHYSEDKKALDQMGGR